MASNARDSIDNSDGSGSQAPPKRSMRTKQVVCTACRQSKVRCVATGQEDCSRCSRLGLECKRDMTYKRQSKSRKIAELEKQVHLLTSAFNNTGTPKMDKRPSTEDIQTPSNPRPLQIDPFLELSSNYQAAGPGFNNLAPAARWSGPIGNPPANGPRNEPVLPIIPGKRRPATQSRTLKSLTLSPTQIDKLFQVFFDHYYPSLPFLRRTVSPDDHYDSGVPLFWAIISVASRRYNEDFMLFSVLSEWVPKLVWSAISTPPYNIATVQAVILLAAWPFPTESTFDDTMITLSSIAISIAMQIGLHRPWSATDFQRTKVDIDQKECMLKTVTWAAANIVSQTANATFGLLPTAPFDKTIDLACQPGNVYTVLDVLRFKLRLQRYCNRATKVIYRDLRESTESPASGDQPSFMLTWESSLNELNYELDQIEREHTHLLSVHDKIYVAAARLYVHSMYFFDSSKTETRKQGILKAYSSAVTLINVMTDADKAFNFFSYTSAYHQRMYLMANCILLKVLRSSYSQDVDFEAGKTLCNQVTASSQKFMLSHNDSVWKSAKIVSMLWHSSNTDARSKPPELLVKSRLGASLIYDFVWTWRYEFGAAGQSDPSFNRERSPSPDTVMYMPPDVFQDAWFVDPNILDDPKWMEMEGLGDPMI